MLSLVWSLSPTVSQARLYQISCGFPAQRLRWNHHTTTCWARSVPAAQLSSRNILDRSNLMKGYWMITSPSDGMRVPVWDPPASLTPVLPGCCLLARPGQGRLLHQLRGGLPADRQLQFTSVMSLRIFTELYIARPGLLHGSKLYWKCLRGLAECTNN